jgi:hypothetical protein
MHQPASGVVCWLDHADVDGAVSDVTSPIWRLARGCGRRDGGGWSVLMRVFRGIPLAMITLAVCQLPSVVVWLPTMQMPSCRVGGCELTSSCCACAAMTRTRGREAGALATVALPWKAGGAERVARYAGRCRLPLEFPANVRMVIALMPKLHDKCSKQQSRHFRGWHRRRQSTTYNACRDFASRRLPTSDSQTGQLTWCPA